ncbi:MAG: glycogen/starch/alpha-glucan phosphorylase [Planctomycetes bacterium]|nr:glycogen/starch/alpha-glucan phosphorylase [Planctomycetota bacterium]
MDETDPGDPESLRDAVLRHARGTLGREWDDLSPRERLAAVSWATRERILGRMLATERRWRRTDAKRVAYLSMEFLMGRSLENNLRNLGLWDECRAGLAELGVDVEELAASEADAALGNGGLGRLAACFLDAMASLDVPGYGYGINYEYGLFRQSIDGGWQRERPDAWRALGTPWLVERADEAVVVPLRGHIEHVDGEGPLGGHWLGWDVLVGVPHDMPVVGHGGRTVNALRLYSARASDEFDIAIFNEGDYLEAVRRKMESETVSKVLYPPDGDERGRELRLVQEYFFTSCAIQDIVKAYLRDHDDLAGLPDKVAIQLNDTHPALAVAELMRVLMDEHGLGWDAAWSITTRTLAYTNHTLLPEALECWSAALLRRVLPRHLQIVEHIDHRFQGEVGARFPGDEARRARMAIVDRGGHEPMVRMAHLAIVGSHSVNGVARLHSELVKSQLVPDFHGMWPERFNNKTNGVTHRRWLAGCNPELAALLDDALGTAWRDDLTLLRGLEPFADDASFREDFLRIKHANKERLATIVEHTAHVPIDPCSLFDVQAKRIHEYKRQLLMALGVVHEYLELLDGRTPPVPRSSLFAGKAAPGYWAARQHIKFINSIARVIDADPRARDWMRVAFVPDYRVSLAERMIPAADLSEQISTAGMEASGTGNMKFALNGALTLGTLDGANIEIRDEVGEENIFIFGLTADEVAQHRERGSYRPRELYEQVPELRRVLDALDGDLFSSGSGTHFRWIKDALLDGGDPFFVLADLPAWIVTQQRVGRLFADPHAWARKAVLNVARMGFFSSDRTVREYARDIWHVPVRDVQAPRSSCSDPITLVEPPS